MRRLVDARSQNDGRPRGTSGDVCESRNLPRSTTLIQESAARATSAHTAEHAPAGQPWPATPEKRPNLWANPVLTPPTSGNPLSGCYLPFPRAHPEAGRAPQPNRSRRSTLLGVACPRTPISRYEGSKKLLGDFPALVRSQSAKGRAHATATFRDQLCVRSNTQDAMYSGGQPPSHPTDHQILPQIRPRLRPCPGRTPGAPVRGSAEVVSGPGFGSRGTFGILGFLKLACAARRRAPFRGARSVQTLYPR